MIVARPRVCQPRPGQVVGPGRRLERGRVLVLGSGWRWGSDRAAPVRGSAQ